MKKWKGYICVVVILLFALFVSVPVSAAARISQKSIVLTKGQIKKLKVTGTRKKIKWSSSKKSVVSVNANGKIKALRNGKAKIAAKIGGKKYICKVKVETPKLTSNSMTISVGKKVQLKMKGTSRKAKWQSSNTYIATVNSNGEVRGNVPGSCLITAKLGGKKYTCRISVKQVTKDIAVTGFELSSRNLDVIKGKSVKITATISPYNATKKEINWVSSDTSIASVDAYGNVTGKKVGKTTVVAVCSGIVVTCNINVIEDPDAVTYITYMGEQHTPSDVANNVYVSNWKLNEDFDIAGQTYDGGIKISVSNTFAMLGGGVKHIVSETHYALNKQALDKASAYERRYIGKFVVGKEMSSSPSMAVISILLDGAEVYKTETINCFILDIPPFDVDLTGHREMIVKIDCQQSGDPFVIGMVNKD